MTDIINVSVENKIATKTDDTEYVCGNSVYVAKFAFDSEWDAYDTKTARFSYNGRYIDIVFTGTECHIPIISDTYFFNIGVYAGNLHTTTPARVPCKKSILCDTGAPADPPDDVYNQIMAKLNSLGSADPEAIAKAVADYLAAHPIEETDPTVPEWAKAETKPTYTADEVGAISQDDLQTATNNALAQAKASGEFDGPAGTPGKDGAGMDITGATIGQIAKITAVDSDGKPTAWSPVDMAGGEEKWEKIAEIELRSDTSEYVLADFATWRKAKVIMTRPAYISGLSKNVWCKVVGQDGGDTYNCGYLGMGYGYVFWEFSAEVNDLFISTQALQSNNTQAAVNVQSTGTFTPLKSPIEKYKFELIFVDTSVIQAGDKVTVIGVRR